MAVTLLGSANAYIRVPNPTYPTRTVLTVAFTFKPAAITPNRLVSEWGGVTSEQAWMIGCAAAGIGLTVRGGGAYFVKDSSGFTPVAGTTYHIAARWKGSGAGGTEWALWINGARITLVDGWAVNPVAEFTDTSQHVELGRETDESINGVDGDYSEWAIWSAALADAVCLDLSNGRLPECYPTNGFMYWRGATITDLADRFGANVLTQSGGSNATHPTMVACGAGGGGLTVRQMLLGRRRGRR